MNALISIISGNIFVLMITYAVWRRLKIGSPPLDLAIIIILSIFTTSLFVLILGLSGGLNKVWIATVSKTGILLLWIGHLRFDWLNGEEARNLWRSTVTYSPVPVGLFVMLLMPALIRSWAHAWYLPPYVYDVLTYHLPKVADWIRHNELVMVPTNIHRAFWPSNFELLQTWFVVFFHHDAVIELAGLPFYFVGILSVVSLARSLGCSPRASLIAGLFYAYTPAVLQNTVSAKNDIVIASIYLFVAGLMMDERTGPPATGRRLLLIIVALAYAFGAKPYIVFIAPGFVILGVACLFHRARDPFAVLSSAARIPSSLVIALLIAASGMGLYWYARNYFLFQNPFHPADFHLFGKLIFGSGNGDAQQGSFSINSLLSNVQSLFVRKVWDRGLLGPELPHMSGWGWSVVTAGLPCAVWAFSAHRSFRILFVAFSFSLLILFGWVTPDPWNMRFALWTPAIFCLATAITLDRLRSSLIRMAMLWLLAGCVMLNVLTSMGNGYLNARDWRNQMKIPLKERSTARMIGGKYEYAVRQLSPGEILAYDTHPNDWLYPFYGADYSIGVYFLPADGQLVNRMDELGLRHFYIMMPVEKLERERGITLKRLSPMKYGLYVREEK